MSTSLRPTPSPGLSKLPLRKPGVTFSGISSTVKKRPNRNDEENKPSGTPAKVSKLSHLSPRVQAAKKLKRRSIRLQSFKPPVGATRKPVTTTTGGTRPLATANRAANRNVPARQPAQVRSRTGSTSSLHNSRFSATSGRSSDVPDIKIRRPSNDVSTNHRFSLLEDRLKKLEMEKAEVECKSTESNQAQSIEIDRLNRDNDDWSNRYEELIRQKLELENKCRLEEKTTGDLKYEKDSLERRLQSLESDLSAKVSELDQMRSKLSHLLNEQLDYQGRNQALKHQNEQLKSDSKVQNEEISNLKKELSETEEKLVKEQFENDLKFRELHNKIMDLKGNIRVMCRVRPPLVGESGYGSKLKHIKFPDKLSEGKKIELLENKTSSSSNKLKPNYEFDRVFPPTGTQQEIFVQVKELAMSALHGYNIAILAYGQTGSGKTYTMEGVTDDENENIQIGVIPRAVLQLFQSKTQLESLGWTYNFHVSVLQIYNEDVKDLLTDDINEKLKIIDNNGNPKVVGLSEIDVSTPEQVMRLLRKASKNRFVAATKCNEKSSRSHAVFRIHIDRINKKLGKRMKESLVEGDRLTETKHINKSLSALERCITVRLTSKSSEKDPYVPYRDSSLTWILKNSLGAGDSKTLMIAAVSPLAEHENETRRTLEFAVKASKCHIGVAKRT